LDKGDNSVILTKLRFQTSKRERFLLILLHAVALASCIRLSAIASREWQGLSYAQSPSFSVKNTT